MTTNEPSELPIAQNMPITKMLEEANELYYKISQSDKVGNSQRIIAEIKVNVISFELLPQVRILETEHVANVSRAKADSADGWISVKDRLPEENGTYLCCASGMFNNSWEAYFKKRTGFWNGKSGRDFQDYVTHWQPLPLPPKK